MTMYSDEFKAKMEKDQPHLCDTCRHQIRGMQNGCRAGIHELGLVWQCMSYEYYGPSRQDIDEALAVAGNTKSKQIGGDHYAKHKIQPWDIVDEYGLDYYLGNALKYLLRDKHNKIEDLQKCQHYIEKAIKNLQEVKLK